MEVTYTTTLNDYVAYSVHMLKRSSSMKRWFFLSWAMVPLGCWFVAALLLIDAPLASVILAISGGAYTVLYPFIYRASLASTIRAYARDLGARGVIGRITLVLTEDTLTERTVSVQSVARWQNMEGVEEVGDCTYIHVTGLQSAIVPRHGFEREEDYEAVRDFAVAKLAHQTDDYHALDRS